MGGIQTRVYARMPCSFDVLHPGAEQVVLVAFDVEVLSRRMPGQICRIVSTDVYRMMAKVHSMAFLS